MPYDRFTLEGGLDLSTPYIKRGAGSLLQSQNFECDTDGGYRVMRGYERYDGQPLPSNVDMYQIVITGFNPDHYGFGAMFYGDYPNKRMRYISFVDGQSWFDSLDGWQPAEGDMIQFGALDTPQPIEAISAIFPDVENVIGETYPDSKLAQFTGSSVMPPAGGSQEFTSASGARVLVHQYAVPADPAIRGLIGLQLLDGTVDVGDVLTSEANSAIKYTLTYVGELEDYLQDFTTPQGATFIAGEARRSLIKEVPGSGPVRGVWDFRGFRYAFRDNAAGTQGIMHKSSPTGWQPVALGFNMLWSDRPLTTTDLDMIRGDVVTGATSGATATIGYVGYIDQEHKTGYFTFTSITGTFQDGEVISANGKELGKAGAVTANTLSPGGTYRFFNHNFAAGLDQYAMHGVNGTGRGFVFDGVNFALIRTGVPEDMDKPFEVKVHYDHLFYAYRYGSLQHSVVGNPLDWSGGMGALELGVGAEITDLILTPKSLIICTEKDIQVLLGNSLDSWTKDMVTSHTGVRKFTGAYQSQAFVVARPGLIAIDRVDAFGNFADAVITDRVRDLITPLYDVWGPGVADKTKSQYRMYGADGLNLVFTIYQGELKGIMPFRYNKIVRTVSNPEGRIFFTSDDGYVYESDVGVNNDGEERQIYLRTSYANQGDPDTRKRFRRAAVSITGEVFRDITVSFTFSKGKSDTPNSFIQDNVSGAGGRWAFNEWDRVYWDGPDVEELRKDMDGVGSDVSMIVYQSTRAATQYILEDVSFEYDVRRKVR